MGEYGRIWEKMRGPLSRDGAKRLIGNELLHRGTDGEDWKRMTHGHYEDNGRGFDAVEATGGGRMRIL
eukprot:903371-Prorocentrum_minimum.AAC.1